MAVPCPACGSVSRDPEFCDRCNADLMPVAMQHPPCSCPVTPDDVLQLTAGEVERLSRPEAAVTVQFGARAWRLHWIPRKQWLRWRPRVNERLTYQAPCLPPCTVIPALGGFWVAAEASGIRPEPWRQAEDTDPIGALHRLAAFLEPLQEAMTALHDAGLVWLTFDPREIEVMEDRLCFTNLDLAVYRSGRCPETLAVNPAFAAPEVCRFEELALGPRTDVFHLALFAYYWLANYLPHGFFGEGLEAFGFGLPPLRVFAPALPPGIAGVLRRGLAPDPAQRFASVRELAGAFGAAVERAERRWQPAGPLGWDIGFHTRTGAAKTALGFVNEDNGLVREFSSPHSRGGETRALVVIADGISTCDVGTGALASQMACDVVDAAFGPQSRQGDFPGRIRTACREAAQRLLDWAVEQGGRECLQAGGHLMGTTLTAAWLEGDLLTLAHLGDSRAYLIDAAGAEQLTVDGDLGCALLAAGGPPEEVLQLGGMARALHDCVGGCYRNPRGELAIEEDRCRPTLTRWPLQPGDVIVLCTDGLVEEGAFLDPNALADLVRRHQALPAQALAEKLAEAADACQRLPSETEPDGFGDNISAAVIKIGH
jgi:serine/threonine protein phosphatase PrpC